MKWCINGVQAHVKRLYPTAVYTYCASYVLNLVVSKVFSAADIANCVSTIEDITALVRSLAKRMKALQHSIESDAGAQKNMSVNDLCETRWVNPNRNNNVTKFVEMYPNVLETREEKTGRQDTMAAAISSQYLCAICLPKFIVSLCVRARFSRLLWPLSTTFPSPGLDLTHCSKNISRV